MMDFLPKEPYKRVFVVVFYATLGCILFYLFFRFFWIPLLPFLIALLLSALIRPIVLFLKKKFRIPTQVGTLLLLLLLIFGILVLLYTATVRLLAEAGKFLASEVPEKAGTSSLTLALQSMLSKWFPGAKKYLESQNFGYAVRNSLRSAASSFTASIPGFLSKTLSQLPLVLFFIVVLVIAAYYLVTDKERIFGSLGKIFPERIVNEVRILRRQAGDCFLQYLKAAIILLLVTFSELLIGFMILQVPYPLTLAALIAVIDFSPILGTGTVMVPWAIVSMVSGDIRTALGLLILWAVISTIRQILEPKIIGKKLGLHPFHALVAMYFGFSLFGFTGLVLAPLAITVLIGVIREKYPGDKTVSAKKSRDQ